MLSHTLTHTLTRSHTHAQPNTRAHAHTHTHTHTHTCIHVLTHAHALLFSHPQTLTFMYTFSWAISLSLSLSDTTNYLFTLLLALPPFRCKLYFVLTTVSLIQSIYPSISTKFTHFTLLHHSTFLFRGNWQKDIQYFQFPFHYDSPFSSFTIFFSPSCSSLPAICFFLLLSCFLSHHG